MNIQNLNWIELTAGQNLGVTVIQTTTGGQSDLDTLYGRCNLGLHVGDDSVQVHQNRAELLQTLQQKQAKLARIHWLNQVHGNTIYHVTDELTTTAVSADAHITSLPDVALSIMTADCVPVMIASDGADGNKIIAAVHAGWQGLAKNIIEKTIQKMVHQFDFMDSDTTMDEMQTVTQGWHAWVGACIAQSHYEVDSRVRDEVLATLTVSDDIANQLFVPNRDKGGHYFADLATVAALQLNACGIHNVHQSQLDSYSDNQFYSYRKQTQDRLPATGRMATLIFID